jgi:hypothetical protein
MPYIKKEDRKRLMASSGRWNGSRIKTAGELNYLLTKLALSNYWRDADDLYCAIAFRLDCFFEAGERKYQNHNDVMGAVTGAIFEFNRRFKATHPRPNDFEEMATLALKNLYDRVTAPYEDLKIQENGDVVDESFEETV